MTKAEVKEAFQKQLRSEYIMAFDESDPNLAERLRGIALDHYWALRRAAHLLKVKLDPVDAIWSQAKREYQVYLQSKIA